MQKISQPYSIRTFSHGSLASQEGDLYLPQVSRPPVLCLLHGGFWRMPYGRDELSAIAKDLAAREYAVWNEDYAAELRNAISPAHNSGAGHLKVQDHTE